VTDPAHAHDPWAKWVLDQWYGDDPEQHKAAIESPNPNRCQYLLAPAEDLSVLANGSVDVVTVRSVLIYIADKQRAFNEFYRVLKPGGRLSIFEPINRFGQPEPPGWLWGYDVSPVWDIAQKVRAVYERLQPASDPMLDFDERDLLRQAERAGFPDVHLELQVSVAPPPAHRWDSLLHFAGNPKIPSLEEAMRQVLTPGETEQFMAYLRPKVEAGQGVQRSALAYLWAMK
jgi:SAM-dependent methyltransferase